MTNYIVRFIVDGGVYEQTVTTSSSGTAIRLIENQYPRASNVNIVRYF